MAETSSRVSYWSTDMIQDVRNRFQGSSILVDTKRMVAKANVVSSVNSDMEITFNQHQPVVSKTNRSWVGAAGDHHRRMFNDEKDDIAFILVRLKEHPEDLKLMANNFETTERKLTEMNRQLRSDYI